MDTIEERGASGTQPGHPASAVFRFDPFTLHLGRFELSRAEKPLPLPRVPMEVLILLVRHGGHLVERGQIAAAIWPGEDPGDTVQKINNAVNRLRTVMRDDPNKPRYIQTVIGKGYRFIAAVTVDEPLSVPPAALLTLPPAALTAEAALPAPFSVTSTAAVTLWPHPAAPALPDSTPPALMPPEPPPVAEPKQTQKSSRRKRLLPALLLALFSLAALAAVYLRETHPPARDCTDEECLARSPLTANESQNEISAGALAPDGHSLAYSDADGIKVRSLHGDQIESILAPPAVQVRQLSWSTDGRHLLLCGLTNPAQPSAPPADSHDTSQLWLLSLDQQQPQLLRSDAQAGAFSPDGRTLAFLSADSSEVWIAGSHGEQAHPLLPAIPGTTYRTLLWSGDGSHLLLARRDLTQTLKTYLGKPAGLASHASFVSVDAHTGGLTATTEDLRFRQAALLPGGQILFATPLPSDESYASTLLFTARLDPHTGALLSVPQPAGLLRDQQITALSTSTDLTQRVALIRRGQADIYVGELENTAAPAGLALTHVRQLTTERTTVYPHAWTPDSASVIYESQRLGPAWKLYQQRLDRHTGESIVQSPGKQVLEQITPDGRWLLFSDAVFSTTGIPDTIYRTPADGGGAAVAVYHETKDDEFACPLTGTFCVLRQSPDHMRFVFYAFDPLSGKGAELGTAPWVPSSLGDWALSPDGREVAVPSLSPTQPALEITSFARATQPQTTRELPLAIEGQIEAVHWASKREGWFITVQTTTGTNLDFVDQTGHATCLRQLSGHSWVVPSPDGRKIAFLDQTVDSNLWSLGLPDSLPPATSDR